MQDYVVEVTAFVSGVKSVVFIDESMNKLIGVRNLGNAKLDPGQFFCPTAITMLGVQGLAGATDADLQTAEFDSIDPLNAVTGGLLDIKVNDGEYLLREMVTSRFVGLASSGQDAPKGTIFLDNTTIVKPQYRWEILLATGQNMPAACAVKFLFHGTRTVAVSK